MTLRIKQAVFAVLVSFAAVALFLSGTASAQETTKVIIQFDSPVGQVERAFIHGLGGEISHEYSLVSAIAVELPAAALTGLAHNPRILSVEEDLAVQAMVFDDEYADSWSLANINATPVHVGGNTGSGVKVGIIDSGVSVAHADLAVVGGYDWVQDDTNPDDVYGHGTHVAGITCAAMNGFGAVGVAPDCDLYSLRVLNDAGSGNTSDILAAVNWAVAHDLDIINLSLGRATDMGSVAEATFAAAYDAGVLIVAAAGNSGTARGKGKNTIYPAKYASVIAVAATDSADNRAYFSSTGNEVEIAAPGLGVHSTWNDADSPANPQPQCDAPDRCYKDASGTSMASPQVAGVAALIIAAGVQNNQEVRAILQSTATDLGASGRDSEYGFGLVNAQAAVAGIVVSDEPVAQAGSDQTVTAAEGAVAADVQLDASASYDQTVGGSLVQYQWFEAGAEIAAGATATVALPLGEHVITLRVTDNDGLIAEDTLTVSVLEYTAPAASTKFNLGDNVKTQGVINVRDNPDGTILGQQPRNITGTVVGGPLYAAGYWWWQIDYENDLDGWSVEKWLRKLK